MPEKSSFNAGIKISPDEYFIRQKDAEDTCRKKIKKLIIQALFFLVLIPIILVFFSLLPNFFIVWHLLIVICIAMSLGSLLLIPRAIKYYKYSLERIVEYMLTGGKIITIPQEDYEKFDLIKSKKEKYKPKSINKMQSSAEKEKAERQQREEYERKVEEEFQKQYYPEEENKD